MPNTNNVQYFQLEDGTGSLVLEDATGKLRMEVMTLVLRNYQFVSVGEGMNCTEKIR